MKNLVFMLAAMSAIMLSSCSQKFSVSKRRYNKGFHWASSKSPDGIKKSGKQENNKAIACQDNKQDNSSPETINNITSTSQTFKSSNIAQELVKLKNQTGSNQHGNIKPLTANNIKATDKDNAGFVTTKPSFKTVEKALVNSNLLKKNQSSDTKLILCVIIAIFIPPLGMFLWKQDADIWFIIDLILFLFIFTWFYWGGPGLIGLAAIVIALFRIFDLI